VTSCLTGSQNQALVVDAVADVEGLYTRSHPATVKLQCDKSLCTKGSAKDYPILFQPPGSDSFVTVPVCAKRGTIGADQEFCQDVRASSCRGRGDLVTYLLFLSDLKTTYR
jgi:hypothetical protein